MHAIDGLTGALRTSAPNAVRPIWARWVCLLRAGACYLLVSRTLSRDMEGTES